MPILPYLVEHEHVISGLKRKRAQLSGELEATQQRLRQLIIDLDNVGHTSRVFGPDIDLEMVRPKPLPLRHAANRGEISRAVVDVLREAGVPLPGAEITIRVMHRRSLSAADPRLS